ncbi:hypothetical protein [Nonomuraea rubra]|uniref:Uncharacterized protein n=1 Tax=Nonomuraea rubra TaxID=46180 RepID=A0A7X0P6L6_9ACTN|nr:hypothetical protein [Nonomuraea rubra]MBB6556253.1 hypothetical protein [Nonomuraea rubra]
MTYVLPPTPRAVAEQIDHYEWEKRTYPWLYAAETQIAEQRPEREQ